MSALTRSLSLLQTGLDHDFQHHRAIGCGFAQVLIEALVMEVSWMITGLRVQLSAEKRSNGGGRLGHRGHPQLRFINRDAFTTAGSNGLKQHPWRLDLYSQLGNFTATVKAVASDNKVNVLSRPRIQTSHAVEANLFVERPAPTDSQLCGQLWRVWRIPGLLLDSADANWHYPFRIAAHQPGRLVVMDIRQRVQSVNGS